MCGALAVWDYTYAVVCDPEQFAADDLVPGRLRGAPRAFWQALSPVLPAYVWVGTPGSRRPEGPCLRVDPNRIQPRPGDQPLPAASTAVTGGGPA
jgi:hypothetical protein